MFRYRRQQPQQVEENMLQKVHRTTVEAREFLTAAIAYDYEIADLIERSTPNLRDQVTHIWAEYIVFLRYEYGDDEAIEHWRAFCEYGTITAEEMECE